MPGAGCTRFYSLRCISYENIYLSNVYHGSQWIEPYNVYPVSVCTYAVDYSRLHTHHIIVFGSLKLCSCVLCLSHLSPSPSPNDLLFFSSKPSLWSWLPPWCPPCPILVLSLSDPCLILVWSLLFEAIMLPHCTTLHLTIAVSMRRFSTKGSVCHISSTGPPTKQWLLQFAVICTN